MLAVAATSGYGLSGLVMPPGFAHAGPLDEAVRAQDRVQQLQRQRSDATLEDLNKTSTTPPGGANPTPSKKEAASKPKPRPARSSAEKQRCFKIDKVKVEGVRLLKKSEISALTHLFHKRCVGLEEISLLVRSITAAYIKHGYITSRVYIPEQNIKETRLLRLSVVEGKAEDISFQNQSQGTKRNIATAFPGLVGRPVNLRDLEQGIDQLNRLSSNNAKLKIAPGSKAGQSIIQLSNTRSRKWGIAANSNNYGQVYTGEHKGSIGVHVDDLLGLNDYWQASYERSSVDHPFDFQDSERYGESVSAAFSMPYGYWTAFVDGSYYRYTSFVPGIFSNLETSGTSSQVRGTLSRILHRDQVSKTSASGSLLYKENENLILGNRIETGSRALTIANFGLTHTRGFLGGSWVFSGNLERGLDWFGALKDDETPRTDPKAQFRKWSASISVQRPFKVGALQFVYHGLLSGQHSPDLLFGSEQISLGGYYNIRGFQESVVFGNNGYFSRNELELFLPPLPDPKLRKLFGQFSVFGAFDFGRISGQRAFGIETEAVSGWAAGMRSAYGKLHFEVALSDVIKAPDFVETDRLLYARGGVNF